MEIKDQNIETAVDEKGNEYVSEINATVSDTSADGTVSVAEITTTANPDDPTDVSSEMTVTSTDADGNETVTEYVANEEGVFKVEEESAAEQMAENLLGVEIGDDMTKVMNADGTPVAENSDDSEVYNAEADTTDADNADVYSADSDASTNSIEFNLGDESFEQTNENFETTDSTVTDESYNPNVETIDPVFVSEPTPLDSTYETASTDLDVYTAETFSTDEENQELTEQQAHADAATDAQNAADEFIAQGDYEAAAEARETAENESWEAGDDSMLGSSDAQDLRYAAEKQDDAEYYQEQQAINAQSGDWEAAKEDAQNAAYATSDADYRAGGDDHTGQSDSDIYNLDNAQWHQESADQNAQNAVDAAEDGNFYAAEIYADSAEKEQGLADDFGSQGDPENILADYDPSSEVASGGTFESTYEDNLANVDTGFDTNVDTGFDSSYDVADAGYDSGMTASVDTGFDTTVDTTTTDTSYDSGSSDV